MNWNSDADLYRDCLGIDSAESRPNHYELLGLHPYRVAPTQVTESSNRRMRQLEPLRGERRTEVYERLAAEIQTARDCLADPIRKRAYDRQIQRERFVFPSTSPETRASVASRQLSKSASGTEPSPQGWPQARGDVGSHEPASPRQSLLPVATLFGVLAAAAAGVLAILAYSKNASLSVQQPASEAVANAFDNAYEQTYVVPMVALDSTIDIDTPAPPAIVDPSPGIDREHPEPNGGSPPVPVDQSAISQTTESPEGAPSIHEAPITVTLTSQPVGLAVIVDGVDIGTTPLVTPLAPGEHDVLIQSPTHHPHRRRIHASVDNNRFEFELTPLIQDRDQKPSSSPNAQPSPQRLRQLDRQAILAELPPKVDVVGHDLSKQQKKQVVHTLTSLLDSHWEKRDPQNLESDYRDLENVTSDPRIPFSIGLIMENQNDFPLALYWYQKARESPTVIPHFEAWRRSINIRMRLKQMDLALDECIDLVDVLAGLSRVDADQAEEIERVLAYNVRFVGFVMGYVKRLSEYDARVFVPNVQSVEDSVLARLHQFPCSEDYLAVFDSGKNDVWQTAEELRILEDETNTQNRIEAEQNNQKINQGEVEIRKLRGPHVTGPDGVDYFEDRGSRHPYSYYYWFWPPIEQTRITKDTKAISEWRRVIKPTYRRAPRASQYVQTYFPSNLELVKRNLLDTFPDEHDLIQRVFVTR